MKITITGASGFVGQALSRVLLDVGHTLTGLGTSSSHPLQSVAGFSWISADTTRSGSWQAAIAEADAVVNLAGRTISKRWTRAYKNQIVESRLLTTRHVAEAMAGKNQTLLSTSAIGFYGSRADEELYEGSTPGSDFLARLSVDWEQAAQAAERKGVRVAIMRFGVVLGKDGGALAQMIPPFQMFAGGPLGKGDQWFSWIHMADLLAGVRFLIENEACEGVFNFSAPGALRQKDFARALGGVLGRPAVMPAPAMALRMMMGEMADVLLASQRVRPDRLTEAGFSFRFADAESALADLVNQS